MLVFNHVHNFSCGFKRELINIVGIIQCTQLELISDPEMAILVFNKWKGILGSTSITINSQSSDSSNLSTSKLNLMGGIIEFAFELVYTHFCGG